jgi:hypothetical protein
MSTHVPAGRVNGVSAPVGTVLGPKLITREFVVVTGVDERGVTVGYAQDSDGVNADDPRSVTEARAVINAQAGVRRRLRELFGTKGGDHR